MKKRLLANLAIVVVTAIVIGAFENAHASWWDWRMGDWLYDFLYGP